MCSIRIAMLISRRIASLFNRWASHNAFSPTYEAECKVVMRALIALRKAHEVIVATVPVATFDELSILYSHKRGRYPNTLT